MPFKKHCPERQADQTCFLLLYLGHGGDLPDVLRKVYLEKLADHFMYLRYQPGAVQNCLNKGDGAKFVKNKAQPRDEQNVNSALGESSRMPPHPPQLPA